MHDSSEEESNDPPSALDEFRVKRSHNDHQINFKSYHRSYLEDLATVHRMLHVFMMFRLANIEISRGPNIPSAPRK